MKFPKSRKPVCNQRVAAFSLLELLVVIGILAVLATAGSTALTSGGRSVRGAATAASSVFAQARSEAILRRQEVLVLVDTNSAAATPGAPIRMALYSSNGGGMLSRWISVPGGAIIDSERTTLNQTNISGLANGSPNGRYLSFRYLPTGQSVPATGVTGSGGQFVLRPSAGGSNDLVGFRVQRMGRVTFFDNPASIPLATN